MHKFLTMYVVSLDVVNYRMLGPSAPFEISYQVVGIPLGEWERTVKAWKTG